MHFPSEVLELAKVLYVGSVFIQLEDGRMFATVGGKGLMLAAVLWQLEENIMPPLRNDRKLIGLPRVDQNERRFNKNLLIPSGSVQ